MDEPQNGHEGRPTSQIDVRAGRAEAPLADLRLDFSDRGVPLMVPVSMREREEPWITVGGQMTFEYIEAIAESFMVKLHGFGMALVTDQRIVGVVSHREDRLELDRAGNGKVEVFSADRRVFEDLGISHKLGWIFGIQIGGGDQRPLAAGGGCRYSLEPQLQVVERDVRLNYDAPELIEAFQRFCGAKADYREASLRPEDILNLSAVRTLELVKWEETAFDKLLEKSRELFGNELLAHIRDSDRPGIFAPVDVESDGRWESGCILALHDRAIVGWFTGAVRIRQFERVISYDDVNEIAETAIEPANWRLPERRTYRIETDQPVMLKVPQFKHGPQLPQLIEAITVRTLRFM